MGSSQKLACFYFHFLFVSGVGVFQPKWSRAVKQSPVANSKPPRHSCTPKVIVHIWVMLRGSIVYYPVNKSIFKVIKKYVRSWWLLFWLFCNSGESNLSNNSQWGQQVRLETKYFPWEAYPIFPILYTFQLCQSILVIPSTFLFCQSIPVIPNTNYAQQY